MIKAVIFDYGGVMRLSHDDTIKIAKTYGISRQDFLEKAMPFLDLFRLGLMSENNFWKKVSFVLGKNVPKNSKELWREDTKVMSLYPAMVDFVKQLRKKKIKTAVLSNTIKPHVEITKKKGGYKYFDKVILSCEVGLVKPDPKIYLLAVKKLKVKPNQCIYIDDKELNLEPAHNLGMKTILAKNPKQVINDVSTILNLNNNGENN
jgi:epoxide hydrolase-like predicted phosphatase